MMMTMKAERLCCLRVVLEEGNMAAAEVGSKVEVVLLAGGVAAG